MATATAEMATTDAEMQSVPLGDINSRFTERFDKSNLYRNSWKFASFVGFFFFIIHHSSFIILSFYCFGHLKYCFGFRISDL
ncbi:MAG: hypothetical protein NT166_27215 [Candidatus Aminicenantes bacterium]|nr:hypothetical protein [Candidatus Aminicenantes bacterium]